MRVVLLIAMNFVVELRWTLIVLLAYVVFFTGVTAFGGTKREDVVVLTRMMAIYGIFFAAVMGSATIHNDRRTRRILSVLSKGIARGSYLAGAILGMMIGIAGYCLLIGLGMSLAASRAGFDLGALWLYMLFTLLVSLLAVVTPLFFATFIHPMFALLFAGLALTGAAYAPYPISAIVPVISVARGMVHATFSGGELPWSAAAMLVLNAILLWAAATAIFSRRDIAVAVE